MWLYDAVRKHLDSGTFFIDLALYSSTLDLKWYSKYEVKLQIFSFNLSVYIDIAAARMTLEMEMSVCLAVGNHPDWNMLTPIEWIEMY